MPPKKLTSRALQAAATRKKLIQTVRKLIRKKGFDSVSVSNIAENAGVSVGTFYHHFESKNAILLELLPKINDTMALELDGAKSSYDTLIHFFEHLIHYPFEDYLEILKSIMTSKEALHWIDRDRLPLLEAIIAKGQENHEFSLDYDAKTWAEMLFYANRGMFYHWVMENGEYPYKENAIAMIKRFAWTMLAEGDR